MQTISSGASRIRSAMYSTRLRKRGSPALMSSKTSTVGC
jgi:hypothetical protein